MLVHTFLNWTVVILRNMIVYRKCTCTSNMPRNSKTDTIVMLTYNGDFCLWILYVHFSALHFRHLPPPPPRYLQSTASCGTRRCRIVHALNIPWSVSTRRGSITCCRHLPLCRGHGTQICHALTQWLATVTSNHCCGVLQRAAFRPQDRSRFRTFLPIRKEPARGKATARKMMRMNVRVTISLFF